MILNLFVASIWKDHRSPYHLACATIFVGSRRIQVKKTTGTRDRKLAQRIAFEIEDIGQGLKSASSADPFLNNIKDLRARRAARAALNHVLVCTGSMKGQSHTVERYLRSWLKRTRPTVAVASFKRYETVIERFLGVMGPRCGMDLADLGARDILQFRDAETERVSATTVNQGLKVLRMILKAALEDGVIAQNVAQTVKPLKASSDKGKRREFTLTELKAVLGVCNGEWRSMILFGFYTGARLSDIAALTWANVDMESGEIRFIAGKTGRTMVMPIAGQLRDQILQLPAGDTPDEALHRNSFEILKRQRRSGTLSRQFSEILGAAGLREVVSHKAVKRALDGDSRRKVNELSFHSLRHTAVSLLKKAGVGEAIAMDLVGHDSVAISRHYTHVDFNTKYEAINKLPSL